MGESLSENAPLSRRGSWSAAAVAAGAASRERPRPSESCRWEMLRSRPSTPLSSVSEPSAALRELLCDSVLPRMRLSAAGRPEASAPGAAPPCTARCATGAVLVKMGGSGAAGAGLISVSLRGGTREWLELLSSPGAELSCPPALPCPPLDCLPSRVAAPGCTAAAAVSHRGSLLSPGGGASCGTDALCGCQAGLGAGAPARVEAPRGRRGALLRAPLLL